MLSVSNPALEQLHTSLQVSDNAEKCFRIVPKDARSLTLEYMEFEDSDETFEFNGRTVLALPKELQPFCADKELDVNDTGSLELA